MPPEMATIPLDRQGEDDERPISLGELDRSAGLFLRIAQLTAFERLFALIDPNEIKISEFTVLLAVSRNPDVRQGVLADLLKIKWPNMTKLVRGLEEAELVERRIPSHDRRSVLLRLTRKGHERVEALADEMRRRDREALSMLDDSEYDQILRLCRKVAGWPPYTTPEGSRP
jgi:DNA-binding MarR family transcriptional regulator